ncbi:MAG: trigger factor [Planctomycetaceae bacterium]|nr:trigger factor [Planctomycetaceae bacterium]
MTEADETASDDAAAEATESEESSSAPSDSGMNLNVEVKDIAACRKHIRVRVERDDIDKCYANAVAEYAEKAEVPGFRKGNVPRKLIGRRFRKELSDEVKQKVLIESLEQLAEEYELDPINEPDLDVENLDIPDEGDFEYEFEVEVRPEFELPAYDSLTIERPSYEITDADVDEALDRFLLQYAERADREDGAVEAGDFVDADVSVSHGGSEINDFSNVSIQVREDLRFQDVDIKGFGELIAGAAVGDTRDCTATVSTEAAAIQMRGEEVSLTFKVNGIQAVDVPDSNSKTFLSRMGVESVEEMRSIIDGSLRRQLEFDQRQSAREQFLTLIGESADWELPDELVSKQVENALYREMLEMQQAGFTTDEIRAREAEIRQNALTETRQAMKEHFILDKIATEECIVVTHAELEEEIHHMAQQRGESPRRVRARLVKSGVIENLEAQIRERKAVDLALERASFKDVPIERDEPSDVFALNLAICVPEMPTATVPAE